MSVVKVSNQPAQAPSQRFDCSEVPRVVSLPAKMSMRLAPQETAPGAVRRVPWRDSYAVNVEASVDEVWSMSLRVPRAKTSSRRGPQEATVGEEVILVSGRISSQVGDHVLPSKLLWMRVSEELRAKTSTRSKA